MGRPFAVVRGSQHSGSHLTVTTLTWPRIDLGKTGLHRAHESLNGLPEGASLGAAAAVLQGIVIAGRRAATARRW